MVDALETSPQHRRDPVGGSDAGTPASAGPTLGELINEAYKLLRRDALPFSGHIVIERRGGASHQHHVWLLGPFALVEGGWFGQVLGGEHRDGKAPRWLRSHERSCTDAHWTQFISIDENAVTEGCGQAGVGLGLDPDGPIYCAVTAGAAPAGGEHLHVPMVKVLRAGLRELSDRAR